MIGFVEETEPYMIVLEYLPQGNLRDYLRDVCALSLE